MTAFTGLSLILRNSARICLAETELWPVSMMMTPSSPTIMEELEGAYPTATWTPSATSTTSFLNMALACRFMASRGLSAALAETLLDMVSSGSMTSIKYFARPFLGRSFIRL